MGRSYLGPDDKLFAIIGPSGNGKSTIVQNLVSNGVVDVTPTWTTRPERANETGREHIYVNEDTIKKKAKAGFFLEEPVQLFGLPYWYAMPRPLSPAKGKAALVMIRSNIIELLLKHYPKSVIIQIEQSRKKARSHMKSRGDTIELITARLKDYDTEIKTGRKYADLIIENNDIKVCTRQIQDFIIAQQNKT